MGHSSSFPNESLKKPVYLGSFHEKTIIQSTMLPNKHHMACTIDIHQHALTSVFA